MDGIHALLVAHGINNQLGGLFNSLSTQRMHRHSVARDGAMGLLDRDLTGVRDVVRATLIIHRTDGEVGGGPRPDGIQKLLLLVPAEARRKSAQVTEVRITVLIGGDTKLGKELAARVLHSLLRGRRRDWGGELCDDPSRPA